MTNSRKEEENGGKDADIRKPYKADRKTRPAHLIDEDRQRQIERFQRAVVAAVQAGEEKKTLDYLKADGLWAGVARVRNRHHFALPARKKAIARSRSFICSAFGRPASFFSIALTRMSAIFSAVSREGRADLVTLLRVGAVAMFCCFLDSASILTLKNINGRLYPHPPLLFKACHLWVRALAGPPR